MVTGILSLCGARLPEPLFGASEGNPKGHWEPIDALKLNDAFLFRHGTTWWDPTLHLQNEALFSDQEREALIGQILVFLEACPSGLLLVIKDPRIVALSDFWFEASRRAGLTVKIVIPIRHPDQVAASLAARDGVSFELSSILWLKYNLLAERGSRGLPRVFVEYSNVLSDWRKEIDRISERLAIDLSATDEVAIDSFVDHDLHRQRSSGKPNDIFGQPWISDAYTALSAAARDEPLDTQKIDAIFSAFAACERTFRISLDEFRGRFGPSPQRTIE